MRCSVRGDDIFISTGGRPFDPAAPVLVFVHGSGQSHLSWLLQARFFANRGWSVLAPDLPGHHLSGGDVLATVEDAADWCIDLLDATGVEKAVFIGHSQGGLVTLETARRHPSRVEKIALIASALAIPVNDALITMAEDDEPRAIKAMVSWSHGQEGHRHDHTMPGQSHLFYGAQVMANNAPGVLKIDLLACNAYDGGPDAAAAITCPSLAILAANDKMTPVKAGLGMAAAIAGSRHQVIADAGHFVQSEKSVETNALLRPFFLETIQD
ncbi:MAG: alpha/beta fold hydrolase [Candidatus Puniceispirillales bacterium]